MRKAWLGVVLLLAAGLAGCIGDSGEIEDVNATDAEPVAATNETGLGTLPDGSPVPTEATLAGCDEHGGAFPAPATFFEGMVPDGFSVVPFGPAGPTATVVVIALSCSLAGDEPIGEVWGFLVVEAPEDLAAEDASFSLLTLGAFTTDDRQVSVYEAWGLGDEIFAGDVTVETLQEGPMVRAGHTLGTDGDFTIHMYSTVQGEPAPESAGAARVFGAVDGELTGAMDVTWTESQGGFDQGEATLAFEGMNPLPIPQPQGAGPAWHYWGDSYDITFSHVDGLS